MCPAIERALDVLGAQNIVDDPLHDGKEGLSLDDDIVRSGDVDDPRSAAMETW